MGIDLLSIKPNKVSRDLSGYITYVYGAAKAGKTTFAARANKCLILAFEKGYSAIDGAMAVNINTWAEMRDVARNLKKQEVHDAYNVLAIDTIDIAAKYCTKYICSNNDVDSLGDIPYGKGYSLMRDEFEDVFNSLAKMGYAVIFISHEQMRTVTREDGSVYNDIRPSLSPDKVNDIIMNMSDIIGYAHLAHVADGVPKQVMLTLRDNTGMIACGSRFKYLANEIPFTYEDLEKALCDAIDAQMKEGNKKNFTAAKVQHAEPKQLNFDEMKDEFTMLVKKLRTDYADTFDTDVAPKIVAITNKVLGHGRKVADLTTDQAEALDVVIGEVKDAFAL